jgi:hypothetical protein
VQKMIVITYSMTPANDDGIYIHPAFLNQFMILIFNG